MNLFGRTFGAFLLTFLLAMGGYFSLSFAFQTDPLPLRWNRLSNTLQLCASEAKVQPLGEYQAFLQRVERGSELELSLYHPSGEAVRGHASPPLSLIRRALASNTQVQEPLNVQMAQVVYLRQSEPLVLVGQMTGGLGQSVALPILRALLGLLVAIVACYILARSVSHPILTLQRAAHRLATGDFTVRVAAERGLRGRRDELGELAEAFDTMVAQLDASHLAQRQLLADISHELRSPLARLSVVLELARRKVGEEGMASLDRIEREAERMNQLISELLTLTKLEAQEQLFQPTSLDLTALVHAIATDADFEASARGVRVQVAASVPALPVQGDAELLRRAIENVVRNALRYTEVGTAVEIGLETQARQIMLCVRDHGPGVPEAALAQLFAPFWRVGTDRDRASGGFGLGLAIASRAIRLHGGTITAENAEEGGGLRVTITLERRI